MIEKGYYIKARKIQDSEIAHAPPHVREIWDYFLREANHQEVKKYGKTIQRGQLIRTYGDIIEALHWMVGWRKMSYSKSDCETAMKWLKKRAMVLTEKTTRGMVVTVCNYDTYQDPKHYENHKEGYSKPTGEPQTDDTINKNGRKKEKKVNICSQKPARPRNVLWDKVCNLWGLNPVTPNEVSLMGKICRDLKLKEATPELIESKKKIYQTKFPEWACTPSAVVKNWDLLVVEKTKSIRNPF